MQFSNYSFAYSSICAIKKPIFASDNLVLSKILFSSRISSEVVLFCCFLEHNINYKYGFILFQCSWINIYKTYSILCYWVADLMANKLIGDSQIFWSNDLNQYLFDRNLFDLQNFHSRLLKLIHILCIISLDLVIFLQI